MTCERCSHHVDPLTLDAIEDPLLLLHQLAHVAPCCRPTWAVHLHNRVVDLIARKCVGPDWPASRWEAVCAEAHRVLGCSMTTLLEDLKFIVAQLADAEEVEELEGALRIPHPSEVRE